MASLKQGNPDPDDDFHRTHWSLVLAAIQADSPQAEKALEELCQTYYYPVYAFVRRRGHDFEAAKDLTQEFFARMLAKQYLRIVDRDRGRFRNFLLSCVEHFLSNERKKERTLKRGGNYSFIPLEGASAEERYQIEPIDKMSPDRLLDRHWALTTLELAMKQLQREYGEAGKAAHFDALQERLSGTKHAPTSFAEIAARTGMTEAAARQAASRMRVRYGELWRQCVAQTIANPQDLEVEMGHLRAVLRHQGT